MSKKIVLSLFLFTIFSVPVCTYAQDTSVSASLDKRRAPVGAEINLTIRITGANKNIQAPRLPSLNNFDTYYTGRASHITFINGVSTTKVEFTYILIGKSAGRYTLPAIEILIGKNRYLTEAMNLEIFSGSATALGPAPPRQSLGGSPSASSVQTPTKVLNQPQPINDENIFIQATVDKSSVYPNEQVVLTYSLYTRYDTRYEGFSEEPEMSGFWIEEFPMEREIRREVVRLNGKRYMKAELRKIALFPTTPADYTIKPGSIKVSLRQEAESQSIFDEFFSDSFFTGSGFFSKRETRILQPAPLQIRVKPFPKEGQPANFTGAAGEFSMEAQIDRYEVKQNDPITLKITLHGEGNVETLNKPIIPELQSFKVYDADSSSELFKNGNRIGGRKTFEVVFIPIESGALTIPRLGFSYFDLKKNQYQTLYTPDFQIEVEASDQPAVLPEKIVQQEVFKKDIELEGEDIHFISESLGAQGSQSMLQNILWVILGLNGLLTIMVLVGLFSARKEKFYSANTPLKRRKEARAQAIKSMKSLKKLQKGKDIDGKGAYFEEVDKILTQYLSDKFNLSTYGTTRSVIESELTGVLGDKDPLHESILEVYRICDEARFGRQALPDGLQADAMRILKETIARFEKIKLGKIKSA